MKFSIFKFKNRIKQSTFINNIYYIIGSIIINTIKLFVKPQNNLILFVSFGGKQYNDSPKAIYESMLQDSRFVNYEFVWAFINPTNHEIPGNAMKININSFRYFLITLKARVWISNSPLERRLNYKGKNTYYFGTWHGTPIKKIGKEVTNMYGRSKYNVLCAQGEFDKHVWQEAFKIKKDNILSIGLPRNDVLSNVTSETKIKLRRRLKIPLNKKVILYCPTFRDWERDYMNLPINFNVWQEILDVDYIVLYRAHAMVNDNILHGVDSNFVYNMSDYDDLNDLLIVSDLLISDYSSVFFDYSILNKPMFCYTYDYDQYAKKRGVYFDIRKELPGGSVNERKLLSLIKEFPNDEATKISKRFKEKYVNWYGDATLKATDHIYQKIK